MSHRDVWTSAESLLPPPRESPCVLVVDGSLLGTEAVLEALADEGYDVAVLRDPDELWLALEASAPDLVIGAVDPEGGSALELAAELQVVVPSSRVPFLMVAVAACTEERIALLLRAGADDVVADVLVRPAELRARVRGQLRHKRALDALRHVRSERAALRREAHTDPLTGAWNRRAFEAMLDRRVMAKERLGLLFVDVDHFKKVNDVHGHDVGDAVLVHLADTLARSVRPGDAVARLGGEEFVVIVGGVGPESAVLAAERLRAIVAAATVPELPPLTVSIGVSVLERGDPTSADELLRRADAALYAAKREGRDRVVAYRGDLPVAKVSARSISGAHRAAGAAPSHEAWMVVRGAGGRST